ncbi:MAG: methanol--corrinoid methyltransferase [Clostridiales Family XIII bacterium]|jgi:methanol--5-hydroxybenzimidazolylcobamide Co-methyltransferase|nr:methanol--corrinoid methyltransferase [Clostridiales Family XIII bacterium]
MGKISYNAVAYDRLEDFVYANAVHPVTLKNGMTIGGGTLYPEVNFTLPTMLITEETFPEVVRIYKEIATGISERANVLQAPGFVAEIELLPPTTFNPKWGIEICKAVVDIVKENEAKHGTKGAVRITPVDIREGRDLEHMWHGKHWDSVLETFEGSAKAGAEFLAIESVGGKDVHDEALMYTDIGKLLFSYSALACPDMEKLWTEIVKIADSHGVVPSGDTACGFANTSMVLADKHYIPDVFAAIDRVVAAVRTLVAVQVGAKGPSKDCGYECVYVKAITGTPIATEGRTAAVAHLSHIGNVAMCLSDLWSNESIQHIRLLADFSEVCSFEQLVYDVRLMNEATKRGRDTALLLRDLHADSDSQLNATAYILRPDIVLGIAKELVKVPDNYFARTKAAAALAAAALRKGYDDKRLQLSDKEVKQLDKFSKAIDALPQDEQEFFENGVRTSKSLRPEIYDIKK